MDMSETISAAREALTVKRVYGEPYERNGIAVIPAAAVQGGGGGGGSEEETAPTAAAASESRRGRSAPT